MSAREPQRWILFQQEAAEAAVRIVDALSRQPRDVEEAARAAFTLSTAAALVRLPPLLRLGQALRAALHLPPAAASSTSLPAPLAEPLRDLIVQAAAALPPWIGGLAPGAEASLPRVAEEAACRLEQLAGASPSGPASSPPPADGAAVPERFVPLVEEDMLESFLEESHERLESLGQKLLQMEVRPQDPELIADIFRDLHTLKGSSGFVGLRAMNRLAHAAEDLVGQLRAGARAADRGVVDSLLGAVDGLRTILAQASRRGPERTIDVDLPALLQRLRRPGPASPAAAPAPEVRAEVSQAGRHTLRVDFDKLDLLLNLVGELLLGKSRLHGGAEALVGLARELGAELRRLRQRQGVLSSRLDPLQRLIEQGAVAQQDALGHLDHVAAELRDQVLRLRMVPIGRVLTKHHRTVRELGHALGRRVRLEVEGADTELDKLLVEQLDDPLLHLVRNAVDHGLEPPEERAARGKPPEGLLRLRAWHRGSQILIEIADDGRGVDAPAVRARAVERGILSEAEAAALGDQDTLELLFRPGFSTAKQVSEVSGRGVGLDVVRRAVQRLKGSVEVRSAPGQGTRFLIRLPLTLAIIQVLLVQARGEVYALPLEQVLRAQRLRGEDVRRVGARDVLLLEDESGEAELPIVDVAQALGLAEGDPAAAESEQLVLVEVAGDRYALRCDRQLGKREIVVKSLGELLQRAPCVAGATLIEDQVVLLLDLAQLVRRPAPAAHAPPHAPSQPPPHPRETSAPRILVAEDSAVEREALVRLLRQGGYEVVAAADGRAALQAAEQDPRGFDLVSTDVMMPHLDGYELTRRLRAQERHRDVPILMLTARAEPLDRVRGFDAGVDDYLLKPLDPVQLLRAVSRHLARSGLGTRVPEPGLDRRERTLEDGS